MAITVLKVLKHLPRTNCGDCGQPTCLAFATQVIKEGEDRRQLGRRPLPRPALSGRRPQPFRAAATFWDRSSRV
jgi:hypothetical protein